MSAPWKPPDLDEVRPDRFVINNEKLRPLLKGEGVTVGKFFELVTWRREGLIARLRMRGFNVRALEDRVAALSRIKPVEPVGEAATRLLHHPKERIATFDRSQLHWRDLPITDQDGKPAVRLPANVAIRRRKGRGHADFYITALVSGQINFVPTKEVDALLHAYAQIAQEAPTVIVYETNADETYTIPRRQVLLPQPHQEVLAMLSQDKAEPWTIAASSLDLAMAVFAKLAILLQPQP